VRLLRWAIAQSLYKARSYQTLLFGIARIRVTVYDSQFSYTTELMCTSVSMHWVMACLTSDMHPRCSREQMRAIMEHGLHKHVAVRSEWPPAKRHVCTVQPQEVLKRYPLPLRFEYLELHGCVGSVPDPEVQHFCVGLDAVGEYLAHAAGVLVTARGHTTALVAGPHGVFHFDPAVAAVRRVGGGVAGVLEHAHRLARNDEYSITVVRRRAEQRAWEPGAQ
jgi:hypothetical protein